jgi:hypothetical protein
MVMARRSVDAISVEASQKMLIQLITVQEQKIIFPILVSGLFKILMEHMVFLATDIM